MKYFAKKVKSDVKTFDSKTEVERYIMLKDKQKKGIISHLELQKEFELLPKQMKQVKVQLKTKVKTVERVDEKAVHYHCDFFYFDVLTQKWIIEEVKSKMTAKVRDYPLRRKLVKMMIRRMNESKGVDLYAFKEIIA